MAKTSQDQLHKMIKELLANDDDKLTPWECDFLDSVSRQGTLSEKQAEILQRIYDKVF